MRAPRSRRARSQPCAKPKHNPQPKPSPNPKPAPTPTPDPDQASTINGQTPLHMAVIHGGSLEARALLATYLPT